MAEETFKLNFVTNGEGIVTIDEPIGFDSADFVTKQDSKRLARSISFSGGENEFTFYRMRNHYFDTLMYYYETYGWESEVKLIIEKDGYENIIGDLDFFKATTDQLEYFKCKVIQDSNEAIVEKRNDINVNVFSDENVDLDPITPLTTENILVKSKPIKQTSSWEVPTTFSKNFDSLGDRNSTFYVFNPSINLTGYEVENSLTFFENAQGAPYNDAILGNDFKIIEAQNNLRKLKVDITNFNFNLVTDVDNGGDGYVDIVFKLKYGTDHETATEHVFFTEFKREYITYNNTNDYTFTIPYLNRGESVWLYFWYKVRQSATNIGTVPRFEAFTTIESMDVNVTATRVAYNTIVPSIRLYDGVSQVIESISGLTTLFPFAQPNGEMYNQRLFNGNLLRNITTEDFNISLKDISEWLPEIYGDYEVQKDGAVFFGLYDDFYTNVEIGVFTDVRFDDYTKEFNERYAINEFIYGYKKFQSQKENEVENTFDVVHGNSQWSIVNKGVENKKEIKISFVRDTFYIDQQRVKALDLTETTSTQDDDTIFILDTKEATADSVYIETDFLQHTYDVDTGYLKLTNTGTFSFILIGTAVGETFDILGGDSNAGTYTIIEVAERYIVLSSGSGSANNNGERVTRFQYIVSTTTAPYISWSDEGFNYIDNAIDTDGFANLKYTVKRNIVRFYNQYLSTCNSFAQKDIKSTLYKNNPDLGLSYEGFQTVEGERFLPTNPILSPYKHNITLITDFNTFKTLESNLKSQRGYIRTYDANGMVIKVYPQSMTFKNSNDIGELTIVGEEKYETGFIEITYANNGYLTINDEYRTTNINYSNNEELFYIFDAMGKLLYNPVFWQKISINGAFPTSKTQLIQWLSLIS
jgi:hypothetical protein